MLYNINQVIQVTTLSKSTIYRLIKESKFPAAVMISRRRVGWRATDIQAYCANLK
jgi:prophage regulatory protein